MKIAIAFAGLFPLLGGAGCRLQKNHKMPMASL
jgi:hypothetical protein